MRIALVVNSFPKLSETFIVNKAIGLRAAGIDVSVLVHSPHNDMSAFRNRLGTDVLPSIHETILSRGTAIGCLRIAALVARHPVVAFRLWRAACKLHPATARSSRAFVFALPLVCGKYDLIHFEMSGLAVAYIDSLPLLRPAKLMMSCRGTAEKITPLVDPGRAKLLKDAFLHMDAVHCVSDDMRSAVEKYGLRFEKAMVNRPAIDPKHFCRNTPYPKKSNGPYYLASVGRLHWIKGLEFALLALRQLKDQGEDIVYNVVGAGEEEEKLRFLIHHLELQDVVVMHGAQSSGFVRDLLERTDVFLLPSLSEGLSNAALEAMAMEIPIVSTDAGGMTEAIRDGVDGFLVSPIQPIQMADKIRVLLRDFDLRQSIGRAGRKRIEADFAIDDQIRRFIEFFKRTVGNN